MKILDPPLQANDFPIYRVAQKTGTVDFFFGLCSDQQLSFFTLLDRASFPHQDHQISLRIFYFMSNFLWTVIFGICHYLSLIVPQNSGNWANPENKKFSTKHDDLIC